MAVGRSRVIAGQQQQAGVVRNPIGRVEARMEVVFKALGEHLFYKMWKAPSIALKAPPTVKTYPEQLAPYLRRSLRFIHWNASSITPKAPSVNST